MIYPKMICGIAHEARDGNGTFMRHRVTKDSTLVPLAQIRDQGRQSGRLCGDKTFYERWETNKDGKLTRSERSESPSQQPFA